MAINNSVTNDYQMEMHGHVFPLNLKTNKLMALKNVSVNRQYFSQWPVVLAH